jgi:hypothetical protein
MHRAIFRFVAASSEIMIPSPVSIRLVPEPFAALPPVFFVAIEVLSPP